MSHLTTRSACSRRVDSAEGLDLQQEAYDRKLVEFGENVRREVSCNCCGYYREGMFAAGKLGLLHPVHTTNYLPVIEKKACNGCGECVDVCAVEATGLVSANDPIKPRKKKVKAQPPSTQPATSLPQSPPP